MILDVGYRNVSNEAHGIDFSLSSTKLGAGENYDDRFVIYDRADSIRWAIGFCFANVRLSLNEIVEKRSAKHACLIFDGPDPASFVFISVS